MVTIVVYVDDLLITGADEEAVHDIVTYLKSLFEKVKVNQGDTHHYLGMTFNFDESKGAVEILMDGYIKELISQYNVTKTVTTPANNNLLEETDNTPLSEVESKELHTIVAKLLYLATRVRFEIMLAVNYLTTRVHKFTKGDQHKTNRVLQYLNGTPNIGLTLCIGDNGPENLNLFADASYGVHEDGKSHSAGVVSIGEATVNVSSHKQKIVTKSSSEAELVCASDMIGLAYHAKDFLEGQSIPVKDITLHQDNTSTISMMCNGASNNSRTRHIRVRYFFIKERIDSKEVRVIHTPTDDMMADILTKPLQGKKFIRLREMLLSSAFVANI